MNEKECMFETMKSEILVILALPPSAGYTWKGICLRLNRREPHNPRAYLAKARLRKNLRRPPLMLRYEAALHHTASPLFNQIVKK